jgi:hypothetical protein
MFSPPTDCSPVDNSMFYLRLCSSNRNQVSMWLWISLFFSNRDFHRRAFEEVLVVTIFSIFPLLLLPFVASIKVSAEAPFDFTKSIWSAVASGQLYLYSFSLFGTLMWLCVEDVSSREFAPRKYFSIAAILAAFLCLIVYGFDPGLTGQLNPVLVQISIWIYAIYVLMYYALLVFKMLRAPSISDTVDAEVKNLITQSRKARPKSNA